MSSLVDRFMRQLDGRGLKIQGPRDGDPDDKLYLIGPQAERTPEVMASLKAFKPELVKKFGRKPSTASSDTGRPQAERGGREEDTAGE